MKKFLPLILSGMFLVCAAGVSACDSENNGSGSHVHSYSKKSEVGATCTESAYVLKECECGDSYKEYDKNSQPLGHNFEYYSPDGNRTCTEDGTMTSKCTRCDEKDTKPDEARGHIFDYYENNDDETCTQEGTMTAKCIACGEKDVLPVPALGHSFKNYVSDNNATCSEYGTKTAKCERCEATDTVTDASSKLPHSIVNGACSECGAKEQNTGLNYRLIGNEYCVSGIGTVTDKNIIIPSEYKGKAVTSISDGAFNDCLNIESVTISEGITSIGSWVFSGCSNLTSVTIPVSVTSIGRSAFSGCGLKTTEFANCVYIEFSGNPYFLLYEGKDVQSCTVHEDTKFIASEAFYYNEELTSVVISDSVAGIGDDAFLGCKNLSAVTFGSGLKTIERSAFENCYSLKSLAVPEGVTEIKQGAFSGCSNLENLTLPNSLTRLGDFALGDFALSDNTDKIKLNEYNNALYIGNESNPYLVLVQAKNSGITSCTVNSDTKFIYSGAFFGTEISSITIPDSVVGISAMAFSYCENLTGVTFGKNIKYIGGNAFAECSKLKSVRLPDSLTELGGYAFYNCKALTSVTLSKNLTEITRGSFDDCYSLTQVSIPEGVMFIDGGAFEDCRELKTVNIPDSVVYVDGSAFSGCYKLNYNAYDVGVYLGNSNNPYLVLIDVNSNVIKNCNVHNDTKIIAGAFSGCQELEKITVPAGVVLITRNTFTYCYVLKNLEFKGTIEEWVTIAKEFSSDYYNLKGCIVHCTDGKLVIDEQ